MRLFCLGLLSKTGLPKNDDVGLSRKMVKNRTVCRQDQEQFPEIRFSDLARRLGGVNPLASSGGEPTVPETVTIPLAVCTRTAVGAGCPCPDLGPVLRKVLPGLWGAVWWSH